jgi:6-phosphofructokinase 1
MLQPGLQRPAGGDEPRPELALRLLDGEPDASLFDRILATRVGALAAEMALAGQFGHMAALRGDEVIGVSLAEATGKLKTVTPVWLELWDRLQPVPKTAAGKA